MSINVNYANSNSASIEDIKSFRKEIQEQYGEKGILPPTLGSEQEKKLYQQWLDGQKKLRTATDDN